METSILENKYPVLKGHKVIERAVKTADMIRERFKAGELNVAFSVRDLENWVDFIIQFDGRALDAMKVAVSDVLPFADAKTVEEITQRNFSAKEVMPWQ